MEKNKYQQLIQMVQFLILLEINLYESGQIL